MKYLRIIPLFLGGFAFAGTTLTGGSIERLGFFGAPPYKAQFGREYSNFYFVEADVAAGTSSRYAGDAENGEAAWVANLVTGETTRVGFFDSAYTRQDDYQASVIMQLDGGYVAGNSEKFSNLAPTVSVAWVADATTGVTTRIGLIGGSYTRTDGFQNSYLTGFQDGHAAGQSGIFDGAFALGLATWMAEAKTGVTWRIGLLESVYTRADGWQEGRVDAIGGGYAVGYSVRYEGMTVFGGANWMADGATETTTRIGLVGPDYTRSDGLQESSIGVPGLYPGVIDLRNGFAGGRSTLFSGSTPLGTAVWVANLASKETLRVGFTDTEYTRPSGFQESSLIHMEGGYATGISARFGLNDEIEIDLGFAAWVADATTGAMSRIGFFDNDHTHENNYQYSVPDRLEGGYVAGRSHKYSDAAPNSPLITKAWVAVAATGETTRVGLIGSGFTDSDGGQASWIDLLQDGYVAGASTRFLEEGGNWAGTAAWVAHAATGFTTRVGFFDVAHSGTNGHQFSKVEFLRGNYASGSSSRFSGSNVSGQTAWVSDPEGICHPISLSIKPDGYAFSEILNLYDSGMAVGRYMLFSDWGSSLGYRAFIWTPEEGARDVGSIIPGGLGDMWRALASAEFADPVARRVLGKGVLPTLPVSTVSIYVANLDPPLMDPVLAYLIAAGVPPGLRADADDGDGDGIANLIEYLYETNPNDASVRPQPFGETYTATGSILGGETNPEKTYRVIEIELPKDLKTLTIAVEAGLDLTDFGTGSATATEFGNRVDQGAREVRSYYLTPAVEDVSRIFWKISVNR